MSGGMIFLAVVVAIVLYGIVLYNNLVGLRNGVKNAFAQIDVQLTRRYDLIPALIESVKGYMKHERETLEAVITARNAAVSGLQAAAADPVNAQAIAELSGADQALSGMLGRLFALSESYPDLKANENMRDFQEQLTTTENKVSFSRQAFNDAVMSYNNGIEMFPGSLIAGWFKFTPSAFLEIESETKREMPEVKF
ncbi:MAG: LemA family protein [Gammaproteobacteria bacterium]|nr:LemA family protein [Gammaproteobacteria bacterium]MDX2488307.1 LemA family protein [Gammaproteobacteria bacterium]